MKVNEAKQLKSGDKVFYCGVRMTVLYVERNGITVEGWMLVRSQETHVVRRVAAVYLEKV